MKLTPPVLAFALAVLLGFAAPAFAEAPVSQTTSTATKDSKRIKKGEDSFTYRCPGVAGYTVLYEYAHGRGWIDFVRAGERTDLMNPILNAAGGAWGDKADDVLVWRGRIKDGAFVPYAGILRMRASTDVGKPVETYVVIQLAGANSRVVGQVPAAKGLAKAEALADKRAKRD